MDGESEEDPRKRSIVVPEPTLGDYGHTAARALISAVPTIGGPAAELFTLIIAPPLTKRRDRWMKDVTDLLLELISRVDAIRLEELAEDEVFISTLLQATQAAMRTHQKEKLDALRNIVLNASMPNRPSDDLQLIFINYLDSMTSWHLTLLDFMNDVAGWWAKRGKHLDMNGMSGSVIGEIRSAFPELLRKDDFTRIIVKDLYARGLVVSESIGTSMTVSGARGSHTTPLGHQFIAFVCSPLDPGGS